MEPRENTILQSNKTTRIYAVQMSNGAWYGVPARIIADHYAKHYRELGENYDDNYSAMINWFDSNDYEFADWAKDNMDWDDVKEYAFLMRDPKEPDYQDGWVNGKYSYRRE